MSSSCENLCVPLDKLWSCISIPVMWTTPETVVRLLHQNHFSPNPNYCSPDRRHKHTMALNIKTRQVCLSCDLTLSSHTIGISDNDDLLSADLEHFFLLLLVAHHNMLEVLVPVLQPFGSLFFVPSCDNGPSPSLHYLPLNQWQICVLGVGDTKLWVQRACEHWWVMEQTCKNQHGGMVISYIT